VPWDFALILLVLGVLVPWRGAVRIRELLRQPALTTADRLAVYATTLAFQWLAVGVTLWRAAARGLTAEHLAAVLPDPARAGYAAIVLTVVLLANQVFSLRRLARLPPERQGVIGDLARKVMPQNLVESLAFTALACTVALCEELLYRGFVFAALYDFAGQSVPVAILGSSVFFALAHSYQGRRGLLATFLVGLLFAGVRAWTGSLAPCVVVHLAVDFYAGLAAPRLLRAPAAAAASQPLPAGPAEGA